MIALGCRLDFWRNFVSYAPDILLKVKAGSDPVLIDLSLYLVQGARTIDQTEHLVITAYDTEDIDVQVLTDNTRSGSGMSPIPNILGRVPTERGWRLAYRKINEPAYGVAYQDTYKTGFLYKPTTGEDAVDCFNYIFNNGTQSSNIGTINVLIEKAFDVGVPLDLTYTVLWSNVGYNGDSASMMFDSDPLTIYNDQFNDPVVELSPNIEGELRKTGLVLDFVDYDYLLGDPITKAKVLRVYNWDGSKYYLHEEVLTLNPTHANSATEPVRLVNKMPLFDGDPKFKLELSGTWSGEFDGYLSAKELRPNVIYDPKLHAKLLEDAGNAAS